MDSTKVANWSLLLAWVTLLPLGGGQCLAEDFRRVPTTNHSFTQAVASDGRYRSYRQIGARRVPQTGPIEFAAPPSGTHSRSGQIPLVQQTQYQPASPPTRQTTQQPERGQHPASGTGHVPFTDLGFRPSFVSNGSYRSYRQIGAVPIQQIGQPGLIAPPASPRVLPRQIHPIQQAGQPGFIVPPSRPHLLPRRDPLVQQVQYQSESTPTQQPVRQPTQQTAPQSSQLTARPSTPGPEAGLVAAGAQRSLFNRIRRKRSSRIATDLVLSVAHRINPHHK